MKGKEKKETLSDGGKRNTGADLLSFNPSKVEKGIFSLPGLIVSVGGLTERLVKFSSASLFAELKNMPREQLDAFLEDVISIFQQFHKNERITIPMFKFLDQILSCGYLDEATEDPESILPRRLLDEIKVEITKCGDPAKLILSTDVVCALLAAGDPSCVKKCLIQLSIFMCHRFPRVRRVAANKLYEALLTFSDKDIVPFDKLDEINDVLTDTNWEAGIETLRPIRNNLCEMMGVQAPTVVKKLVG